MKNVIFMFVIIFSLVSCTKDEIVIAAQAVDNFKKFYIPEEKISPEMSEIYNGMQTCDLEVSRLAYERFANLTENEYIEYMNFLALNGAEKYDISIDTAIYILAKRIDYSKLMFKSMPNHLDFDQMKELANAISNGGLPVSLDPNQWPPISRGLYIEKSDKTKAYDCLTGGHFDIFYPSIVMEPPGKVKGESCNFLVQQMLDEGFITLKFDQSSNPKYMLRITANSNLLRILDSNFDFVNLGVNLLCPKVGKNTSTALN